MSFNDDDDVDYQQLRKDRALDRSEADSIRESFHLKLDNDADKFIALLEGEYHAPPLPGEPDRITRPIKENTTTSSLKRTSWQDMEERDTSVKGIGRGRIEHPINYDDGNATGYRVSQRAEKYGDVLDSLDRFKFSDDENRRKKQMSVVATAIRNSLQELILEDVAINTRQAFGKHVEHVYKVAGGIKVVYNFNGSNCTVIAKGVFFGDETVCVHSKTNKIVAGIYCIDGENSSDLSPNFDIMVSK